MKKTIFLCFVGLGVVAIAIGYQASGAMTTAVDQLTDTADDVMALFNKAMVVSNHTTVHIYVDTILWMLIYDVATPLQPLTLT